MWGCSSSQILTTKNLPRDVRMEVFSIRNTCKKLCKQQKKRIVIQVIGIYHAIPNKQKNKIIANKVKKSQDLALKISAYDEDIAFSEGTEYGVKTCPESSWYPWSLTIQYWKNNKNIIGWEAMKLRKHIISIPLSEGWQKGYEQLRGICGLQNAARYMMKHDIRKGTIYIGVDHINSMKQFYEKHAWFRKKIDCHFYDTRDENIIRNVKKKNGTRKKDQINPDKTACIPTRQE